MLKKKITEGKRYTLKTHINDVILPREESEAMEAFLVIIEPGKSTPMHVHPENEQLYYVLSGAGLAVLEYPDGRKETFEIEPEDMVHIPCSTRHQIFCTSVGQPLRYLCVDGFPAGRPTSEPTWDDHYRAIL